MSEEEEEIPLEEVSEEKGEVVEEEGEEILRGFTIEGLELMLSRVEEIEKLIKGVEVKLEEKPTQKMTRKGEEGKEKPAAKTKKSKKGKTKPHS
ncbi:MAG: hypothetical protein QXD94_04585 [Sulfolobales archaeon]